jgi:hypothetical protein
MQMALKTVCWYSILLSPTSVFAGEFVSLFNGEDLSGWVEMGEPGAFVVEDGILLLKNPRYFPNWLRSKNEYENFEFSLEYRMPGWSEAGVVIHAPLHGRISRSGIKIHLRHNNHDEGSHSVGGVYGVLPPLTLNTKEKEWNRLEIYVNWPVLKVRLNGALIQNRDMEQHPELRWRLRSGFIGLQDIGREIHFRNLQIKELPGKEEWIELFNGRDFQGWKVQGDAEWAVENGKIVARNGDGYLITEDSFSGFEFQTYVRTSKHANGGIYYRWGQEGNRLRGYEAQIYNVLDTTNPTGSIYGVVPARDPDCRDGEWFLMQIVSDGNYSMVSIDGKPVAEADDLTHPDRGNIAFQMHHRESWIEFMRPRVKSLR